MAADKPNTANASSALSGGPSPQPGRKIPAPRVMPEAAPFWQAAQQGRYLVKRCRSCGEVHHYPRDICPFCLSDDTVWEDSPGLGEIYSFSTMGKDAAAYTLAYVTLDEGITVMSNLVDCDPASLQIGQRVRVVFKHADGAAGDGSQAVPMFAPLAGAVTDQERG